jgi:hypothetical protein
MDIERVKEKFKDHVLTNVVDTEKLKVFDFQNPGDRTYYQRWIINGGCLIVLGDCYDAVYWWNDNWVSLKFLAGCGLDYFSEKCRADKDGSNQTVYEADHASDHMKDIAADLVYESFYNEIGEHDWKNMTLGERIEVVKPIIIRELDISDYDFDSLFYHERESEAYDFMMSRENEFMFGGDAWEYDLKVPTATPYFHLAALRSAYEKYPDAF